MAYQFIIHTKGFKPFQWSKWKREGVRLNNILMAMDGLKFRESSEKALRWRIGLFLHGSYSYVEESDYEIYSNWLNRPRNKFRYYDPIIMNWLKTQVQIPGFAQGYCNINAIIDAVKKDGVYHLPFSAAYDIRQYSKNMDACFCEIRKV